MTEALGAMLDFGFTRMGLHSVEAHIHPANSGSRRVLEKLGFTQEGYFRENYYDPVEARFTDTAVYSLLKVIWMSRDLSRLHTLWRKNHQTPVTAKY
jgi:ribosomal-protein-alanine N-acetyltransferase